MPGTSSISGVISGMSTDEIISKLIELERAPITRMQSKKTKLNAKLTAWQDANTRILALKGKMDALASSITFDARKLTSSDEAILKGTASIGADVGTYYLKVNSLARAHQLRTDGDGYADTELHPGRNRHSQHSDGLIRRHGDHRRRHEQHAGGSEGRNQPIRRRGEGIDRQRRLGRYALPPGVDQQYQWLAGRNGRREHGHGSLFGTTVQAAQDASVTMGEGAGAMTITQSSNKITGLLPGVTLDLQTADVDKTITVTVSEDTATVKQAIKDFVDQYNNLIDFVGKQFKYDVATKSTGALFSDSDLRGIQPDINNKLFNEVDGLDQTITLLSQIGVTITSGNRLKIDDTELDEALSQNLGEVKKLFAAVGETSNPNISYVSSTSNTKASTTGYAVEITATASRARVTAGVAQTDVLLADEELTINGTVIHLTAGMTQTQVITAINEQTSKTGLTASATDISGQGTGNYLTLTRVGYGSALTISADSDTSNGGGPGTSGIGTTEVTQANYTGEAGTGTGAAGTDVAGTINGEAATGTGQILTGNSDNENTDGLRLRVCGSSARELRRR